MTGLIGAKHRARWTIEHRDGGRSTEYDRTSSRGQAATFARPASERWAQAQRSERSWGQASGVPQLGQVAGGRRGALAGRSEAGAFVELDGARVAHQDPQTGMSVVMGSKIAQCGLH